MPTGTSKGSSALKIPKLKWLIELGLQEKTLTKRGLFNLLRWQYPDVWKMVATTFGCSVDFLRLFELLGVSTSGQCETCGGTTFITGRSMTPSKFCSSVCAMRTTRFQLAKEASRARSRAVAEKRYAVRVRPEEFPELRSMLLERLSDSSEELTRTELRCYLETNHRELFKEVKYMTRGIDVKRLYKILDMPTQSKCLECGTVTELRGTRFHEFCSKPCKATFHIGAGFKYKTYIDLIGVQHKYQGYENVLLELLDTSPKIRYFDSGKNNVPKIKYRLHGSEMACTFHPDIVAVSKEGERRYVIEVKSTYTLYYHLWINRNRAKFKAASEWCKDNGCEFWLALVIGRKVQWFKDGVF